MNAYSTVMDPVPTYLHGLIDDAAIFPPGNLPLSDAVGAHAGHRGSWYAPLVGPFVVDDRRLDALSAEVTGSLEISVVATGGAGSIDPAVRAARAAGGARLVSVEGALRARDDLASAARRVSTVVAVLLDDGLLDDDVDVSVEVPVHETVTSSPDWQAAADVIAAEGFRLKFRTGGADADAFPSPRALAMAIDAAIDREVPFKCTAGLHHALPHHDPAVDADHHGFLTVLLATRACLDGAGVPAAADVLGKRDAAAIRSMIDDVGPDALVSARRWFRSFGSCSITEPVDDLVSLGLLTPPDAATV